MNMVEKKKTKKKKTKTNKETNKLSITPFSYVVLFFKIMRCHEHLLHIFRLKTAKKT